MALTVEEVEAVLRLRDELSLNLKRAQDNLRSFESKVGAISDGLNRFGRAASTAITLPLSAAAGASLKFSADFAHAMTQVEVLTDIAGDDIARVRQEILDLAPAVGIGPTQLAEAMTVVASTGLQGAEAMEVLSASAKASAVGLGETKDIARAVTAGLTAFGDAGLTASQAVNQLFVAVRAGGAEADEFAGTLGRVIGVAESVGIGFDELLANIATFTRLGIDAAEATTALRGVISTLQKPSDEARETLQELGTSFEELRRQVREEGLTEALIGLVEAAEGNDDALAAIIPNVRALSGVLGTAGAQGEAYREVLDSIRNSTTDLDDAFGIVTQSNAFKFSQLLAEARVIAIEFGDSLAPSLRLVLEAATPLLGVLRSLVEAFAGLPAPVQQVAIAIGAALAAVGPIAFAIGQLLSLATSLAPVVTAVTSAGAAIAGIAAGPVGLLIGALIGGAGLIAAWKLTRDESDEVVGAIDRQTAALEENAKAWDDLTVGGRFRRIGNNLRAFGEAAQDTLASINLQSEIVRQQGTAAEIVARDLSRHTADLNRIFPETRKHAVAVGGAFEVMTESGDAMREFAEGAISPTRDLVTGIASLGEALGEAAAPTLKLTEEQEKLRDVISGAKLHADVMDLAAAFSALEDDLQDSHRVFLRVGEAASSLKEQGAELTPELHDLAVEYENFLRLLESSPRQLPLSHALELIDGGIEDLRGATSRLPDGILNARAISNSTLSATGFANAIRRIITELQGLDAAGRGTANFFTGVATSFNAFVEGLTGGKGIGGFFENVGKGFVDQIGRILTGGITSAITASISLIGRAIGSIGRSTQDNVRIAGREMGIDLSDQMVETLTQQVDSGQFNDVWSAIVGNAGAVLADQGGVLAVGIEKAIDDTRRIFPFIEMGLLSLTQAGEAFNSVFGELIPHSVDFATGEIREDFIELIELAQRFGIASDELAKFMEEVGARLESAVTDRARVLNDVLDDGVDAMRRFQDSGLAVNVDVPEAFRAVLEAARLAEGEISGPLVQGALAAGEALKSLDTLGEVTRKTFVQFGRSVTRAFTQLIEGGATSEGALEALRPALATLILLQDEYGFSTEESTERLLELARAHGITGEEAVTEADRQLEALGRIIEVLERLVSIFENDVPDAINNVPNVNIDFDVAPFPDIRPPSIEIPTFYGTPPPGALPQFPSTIPALGHGGLVTEPTLALIGEAGPEFVIPAQNMRQPSGDAFREAVRDMSEELRNSQLQLETTLTVALQAAVTRSRWAS